jgi:hypothetical protein
MTVERSAVANAQKFARRNGTSLSQIVEEHFRTLGCESFVQRWGGQFKVPQANPKDQRLIYLLRKYVHHR